MNYRHHYHVGNFADVFKHVILVALLQALRRKESAFCFLDTHAGIGRYDLQDAATQKSQEFLQGIAKVLPHLKAPPLIADYLQCVKTLNLSLPEQLHFYPGSPLIARQLLRPQDRMILTELHHEDFVALKKVFPHDKQVAIHHQDGYQGLKAFLPPKERRGLVLIDPPYEKPNELEDLVTTLAAAVMHWETGVYALWYPIKESRSIARFHRALQLKINRPMIMPELCIYPENPNAGLSGCGMVIVNPPWQLETEIQTVLPWLARVLKA
jgi:23S rRNA (adenine2030-N6)-methyltransferase